MRLHQINENMLVVFFGTDTKILVNHVIMRTLMAFNDVPIHKTFVFLKIKKN